MIKSHQAALRVSRRLIACLLAYLLTSTAIPVAAEQPKELLIGIEPEHNIFDQMEQYRFLASYLSDKLGVKVNLTIMSRYGEVLKRFKSLKLDGAFLTAYTATMGIKELNLEPIANRVNLTGESTSQGIIFVRKDSGIREAKDMQGKSIVFVDPANMEGYLFPLAYLKQHGITGINTFFYRFFYSGSHASTIFTVLDGRADIGAAKNTTFNRLVQNDPSIQKELYIIAQSPKVPEITLCLSNGIDLNLRERLATVLLNMDKNAPGKEVLEKFKARQFIKPDKGDFAKIEEMAREAQEALTGH